MMICWRLSRQIIKNVIEHDSLPPVSCIAGGMAEAFYGVPDDFKKECEKRLPEDALKVLHDFTDLRIHFKKGV